MIYVINISELYLSIISLHKLHVFENTKHPTYTEFYLLLL